MGRVGPSPLSECALKKNFFSDLRTMVPQIIVRRGLASRLSEEVGKSSYKVLKEQGERDSSR